MRHPPHALRMPYPGSIVDTAYCCNGKVLFRTRGCPASCGCGSRPAAPAAAACPRCAPQRQQGIAAAAAGRLRMRTQTSLPHRLLSLGECNGNNHASSQASCCEWPSQRQCSGPQRLLTPLCSHTASPTLEPLQEGACQAAQSAGCCMGQALTSEAGPPELDAAVQAAAGQNRRAWVPRNAVDDVPVPAQRRQQPPCRFTRQHTWQVTHLPSSAVHHAQE